MIADLFLTPICDMWNKPRRRPLCSRPRSGNEATDAEAHGLLTISASVTAAALGQITIGLPFFGVLLGAAVVVSISE